MKIGYTKEARLIFQSEIYIFCYKTKFESKKQTVRQTTKKTTNKQTENYEITVGTAWKLKFRGLFWTFYI